MKHKEKKPKRLMVLEHDTKIFSRGISNSAQAQEIEVPPSGESQVYLAGRKCEHGVYIPATSVDPERSEFCSVCHPYILEVKPGAVYNA